MYFHDCITSVVFAGEEGGEFDLRTEVFQSTDRAGQFRCDLFTFTGQFQKSLGFFEPGLKILGGIDTLLQAGASLLDCCNLFGIAPDLGLDQTRLYLSQF